MMALTKSYCGTESGLLSYTTADVNGCDSTTTVMLTVNYSNTGDTAAVACDSFEWYGVTYKEDKPEVMRKVRELIEKGVYPEKLWDR